MKNVKIRTSVCLSGLWCLLWLGAMRAEGQTLVLRNVRVVDVTGEVPTRTATVVVVGDRISAIETSQGAEPVSSARVIDGQGRYLIPGLWDMHVHLTDMKYVALPALVANGVTGVRDMGGNLDTIDGWRREVEAGQLLGPRVFRSGPVVDGLKEGLENRLVVADARDGVAAVREVLDMGADFVKIHNAVPRDAYFALMERSRAAGFPVAGHIPMSVGPLEAVRAGQASLEHTETLIEGTLAERFRAEGKGLIPGLEAFVDDGAEALFRELAEHGTAYTPMLVAYNASAHRNDLEADPDPRVEYVPRSLRDSWPISFPTRWPIVESIRLRVLGSFVRMVGQMSDVGVLLLAGTDLAGREIYPGFSLHDELGFFARAGLSPLQALQTATINPAIFLGIEEEAGSVALGKLADLVLLEADPLADIANTKTIAAVVLRGRYLGRSELDTMLEEARAEAARL